MPIQETKWSKYYDKTKIVDDFDTNRTIYQVLKDSAEKYPDRIIIRYGSTRFTYKQFLTIVDTAASSMVSIGIKKGDVVTLSHSGMPASVSAIYAASKIGATVSLINNALTSSRLSEIVQITGSKHFFLSNWKYSDFIDFYENVDTDITSVIVKTRDYTTWSFRLNPIYNKYRVGDINRDYKKNRNSHVKILTRNEFLAKSGEAVEPVTDSSLPVVLFHSGSATGAPIPVCASSKALNSKVLPYSYLVNLSRENGEPVKTFSCVKQTFSFGLTLSIHATIAMGDTIMLFPNAGLSDPIAEIKMYKPDVLIAYPKVFSLMMEPQVMGEANLSFLKGIICAGESMSGVMSNDFRIFLKKHKCHAPLYRLYGLTESLSAVCYNPPEFDNDSILGIPLPGVNMKIMDRATGMEMPVGSKGEICISYPGNMDGYYKDPVMTSEIMRRLKDGKTWLFTGDFGKEDENGIFYFEGHSKRVVDMGGVHVYPELVENEINNIFGVEECCVVPVGEPGNITLTALVVPISDYITDNDKLEELNQNILNDVSSVFFKPMCPKKIEFRMYLPRKNDSLDYDAIYKEMNSKSRMYEDLFED